MQEVQSSEAKTRLAQILDAVEHGETFVITRHGRAIARLVPEVVRRQEEVDKAIREIKELRKSVGRISLDELLSGRHEGHRY